MGTEEKGSSQHCRVLELCPGESGNRVELKPQYSL